MSQPIVSSRDGNALMPALILLTIGATLLAALLSSSVDTSKATVARGDRFEIKRACGSVNRLAAQSVWSDYEATLPAGVETSVIGLRTYLDGEGLADQAGLTPTGNEVVTAVGLPTNLAGVHLLGDAEVESIRVHREDDGRATMLFVTSTVHSMRGNQLMSMTQTDVFALEPPRWEGLDFALLANNINCIMCHTTVDDAFRVYEGNGVAGTGEYRRARVGSIESFQFRDDPNSTIAGTLYLGGPAVDDHGAVIDDWSALTMSTTQLDAFGRIVQDAFGTPTVTGMTPADPSTPSPYQNLYTDYLDTTEPVDGVLPDSFPPPFRDDGGIDPLTGTESYAGEGNRTVDDEEFYATTATFGGSISGGSIGLAAPGTVIDSAVAAQALVSGNTASLGASTAGNVVLTGTPGAPIEIDGDVAIDGDLIISGPIVGSGSLWVRGNIYVRGDLEYADADLGGRRQYGVAADGRENALGMTAGGNVVIGDMYRPQWGEGSSVEGDQSGSWSFTLEEAAVFNRREWIKTQPTLPGQPVQVQVGTETVTTERTQTVTSTERREIIESRDTGTTRTEDVYENVVTGQREVPNYRTVTRDNGRQPPYRETWTEQVQDGTRMEDIVESRVTGTRTVPIYENVVVGYEDVDVDTQQPFDPPQYDVTDVPIMEWQTPQLPNPNYAGATYIPRFYSFGDGDPVPIMNKKGHLDPTTGVWIAAEGVDDWDMSELTLADPGDPDDPILYPTDRPAPVISTLEPTDSWMDAGLLEGLIKDALAARDPNQEFRVDATVYSSNSVFGVVPLSPSEGTNGELRVQGALLAADVGLLGPAGTEILFDQRGQDVLDIRDERKIGMTFIGTLPAPLP